MKKWLTILTAVLLLTVVVFCFRQRTEHSLRTSVEETRRQLRRQNFRTDLSDFNFSLPADVSARANEIISLGQALRSLRNVNELQLMQGVGTNVALAISQVETLETYQATNLWPLIKVELDILRVDLDRISVSILAGPLKFQPRVGLAGDILLPYLADYRNLTRALAARAALAMHEHNPNTLFPNLLVLSRMATAWTPEPVDISHLVRFGAVDIAQQAIWEAMQTEELNDAQLMALQREWQSARFLEGLPETAELGCANMVRMCQTARDESYSANFGGWGMVFREIFTSPANGLQNLWSALLGYTRHVNYRNHGSYEDEKALLLYYLNRHQELKRNIKCSTWKEMRSLPGATNITAFQGANQSIIQSIMNLKQLSLGAQSQGRMLVARAVEAEAKRRLIVTALTLKRFASQHKTYPTSLSELVPEFLPEVPVDFMDNKPLRYRQLEDGRVLLYSIGLDCVDNGGQMITIEGLSTYWLPRGGTMSLPYFNTDIVWPLAATEAEINLFEQQRKDYEGQVWQRYGEQVPNLPAEEMKSLRTNN